MSPLQIEERLSKLEAEVAQLKHALLNSPTPTKPWWEDITGIFADDPAFEEAMALGREYRQSCAYDVQTHRSLICICWIQTISAFLSVVELLHRDWEHDFPL